RQIAVSYQGTIWRAAHDGSAITRLTDGAGFDIEPAWSPDAARIAFVNAPRMGGGSLRLIRADTGEAVPLPVAVETVDVVSYSKLDFHPDGRLLGYFRIAGSDAGLALLDVTSGKAQTVVKPPKQTRYALSRDGKWLAYSSALDVEGQQWGNDGPQHDIWKIA